MIVGDLKLFESASQFLLGNGFVALLYKIAGATKRKQKSKEKYIYFYWIRFDYVQSFDFIQVTLKVHLHAPCRPTRSA
jgi:hypothetical protein